MAPDRIFKEHDSGTTVEVPVGDFFAMGWGKYARVSSLAVCVNPGSAFNSYWPLPFRRKARLTIAAVRLSRASVRLESGDSLVIAACSKPFIPAFKHVC